MSKYYTAEANQSLVQYTVWYGCLVSSAGVKFMCGAQGWWVEGINHKIGVVGRPINILIAQLPQQSVVLMHVMWAQLRRAERFTVGRGRKSWSLQGTPTYRLPLQKLLIIQQAEKSSATEHKSWSMDPILSQIHIVHISHSNCDRTGNMLPSIINTMTNPFIRGSALADWPGLRILIFALILGHLQIASYIHHSERNIFIYNLADRSRCTRTVHKTPSVARYSKHFESQRGKVAQSRVVQTPHILKSQYE